MHSLPFSHSLFALVLFFLGAVVQAAYNNNMAFNSPVDAIPEVSYF